MNEGKLKLNHTKVQLAREYAKNVAADTQNFIDIHTTVAVERTICRLLGIDGKNEIDVPLPNVVVDHLASAVCLKLELPSLSGMQWLPLEKRRRKLPKR